jgi:putative inorganic carbon (HCO3(-)) transporter
VPLQDKHFNPQRSSQLVERQRVQKDNPASPRRGGEASPMHSFLLLLAILLIINHLGRPFEFFLTGLKIPLVLCALAAIVAFITRAIRGLRTSIGLSLTAFIIWQLIITPLSTWRGGSSTYALYYAGLWLVFYLVLAAAPWNMRDIQRLGVIVVVACVMYVLIGGKMAAGRLAGEGTFGDSDDIALMGGFVLPFLILLANRLTNTLIRIVAIMTAAGFMVYAILLTATRAAILGLAVMMLVYLLRSTSMQRVAILIACVICMAVTLVSLPSTTLQRFSTIFEGVDGRDNSEATQSTQSRLDIWKDAIDTTLRHPIFGVGPGQFTEYHYHHYLDPRGTTKKYLPTHQTFLEVSSETGIPGLVIYVTFIGLIYMRIRKGIKLNVPNSYAEWMVGRQIGVCLEASFAYFVTCAFFMTCDKHPQQFLVAGLAVALERVSRGLIGQAVTDVANNRKARGNSSVMVSQGASFRTAPQVFGSRA